MANYIRGPFDIKWGDYLIEGVSELETDMDPNTDDQEQLDGQVIEFEGARKMAITLTVLKSDVAVLRGIIPQYWVANGQQMSTGETVNEQNGAMDFVSGGCATAAQYHDLDIISCGNPGQVTRIKRTRTRLENFDISPTVQTVQIRFIGEPDSGDAFMQMFEEGSLTYPS